MNRYAVTLHADSYPELADAWMNSPFKRLVNEASDLVMRVLLYEPQLVGADHHEGLRRIVLPPLAFYFEVNESQRACEIVSVRHLSLK